MSHAANGEPLQALNGHSTDVSGMASAKELLTAPPTHFPPLVVEDSAHHGGEAARALINSRMASAQSLLELEGDENDEEEEEVLEFHTLFNLTSVLEDPRVSAIASTGQPYAPSPSAA